MSFLSKLFKKQKTKTVAVTLIGPSKSGKTTLVKFLETGRPVEEELPTTLGIDIRKDVVNLDGWKIRVIDTGGQVVYQQTFWELAVHQADAVIFVIDATLREEDNPKLFNLMKEQFLYALDITPTDKPIMILLNKQDLVNMHPMSETEAIEIFPMESLVGRTISFQKGSAKYGDGIAEAMTWMITRMEEID